MYYLLLNIGIIVLCYLYMYTEKKIKYSQRKYVVFALIILSSLLFAFRPEDSKDVQGYINGFINAENISIMNISFLHKYNGYELGYIYLMRIFKIICNNFRVFFFVIAFSGIVLACYSLAFIANQEYLKKDRIMLRGGTLAFYISNFGLLYNGISVRAGFSMAIGLYAVTLFLRRRKIHLIAGLLLLFLAFTMQRSSALFIIILLVFFLMPELNKKTHFMLWIIFGILMFSGIANNGYDFISGQLNSFLVRYDISGYTSFLDSSDLAVGLRDIYLWVIYLFLIMIANRGNNIQKCLNIVMIGTLIIVFMHGTRAISRAYDMFFLFEIPILTNYFYDTNNDKKSIFYRYRSIFIALLIFMNAFLMLKLCFD